MAEWLVGSFYLASHPATGRHSRGRLSRASVLDQVPLENLVSCSTCNPRAEDCWDWDDEKDDDVPCDCPCHDDEEFHRASGSSVCGLCKKAYREHSHGGPVGMDGRRFLRRLCNGELVKL